LVAFALVAGVGQGVQAQWVTQTNTLKPGWNAVYLHVDASHATLDELVGSIPNHPILEIWAWQPALPTGQFVESPQLPTGGGSQWITWSQLAGPTSPLQRLAGNGAYLVKVATTVTTYNWLVKGKPVAPTYRWTLTGLNFVGFPTPPSPAPYFQTFLEQVPQLLAHAEVYRYQSGNLGLTNPVRVANFRTQPVRRDQAYWVRAGESYNQYFGPILILQSSPTGIHYGQSRGQAQFRLRNLANVPVVITLRQIASETPPVGQTDIAGLPPLLLRGPINNTNLTFGYTELASGPQTWSLAAAGQVGSEVEVVLGVNRSQMTGPPGTLFAAVVRLTDSLGLSQVDLAVSAEMQDTAGLWVGGATVTNVSHYLKKYAKATNDTDLATLLARLNLAEGADDYHYERDALTSRVLVFGGPQTNTGSYLLDGPIKIDSGDVASPFPLRLILHNNGTSAKLLQKVFYGVGLSSNSVVATRENLLLASQLATARRISSVHFPSSPGNLSWSFTGFMQPGGTLTGTVPLSYDDQTSNPFLHTYHPDHDNFDAQFSTPLPRGLESYGVTREIALTFTAPANDFNSLTRSSQDLDGRYAEQITFAARGTHTRQYNIFGGFVLKRLTDIATLTQ